MTEFVAGWNIPGYLPDNTPEVFDDASTALEYLRDAVISHFEDDPDVSDTTLEECKRGVMTWQTDANGEFGITVGPYHYFISEQ